MYPPSATHGITGPPKSPRHEAFVPFRLRSFTVTGSLQQTKRNVLVSVNAGAITQAFKLQSNQIWNHFSLAQTHITVITLSQFPNLQTWCSYWRHGLQLAVSLSPVLSSTSCSNLSGFYTGIKVDCLVTEVRPVLGGCAGAIPLGIQLATIEPQATSM